MIYILTAVLPTPAAHQRHMFRCCGQRRGTQHTARLSWHEHITVSGQGCRRSAAERAWALSPEQARRRMTSCVPWQWQLLNQLVHLGQSSACMHMHQPKRRGGGRHEATATLQEYPA